MIKVYAFLIAAILWATMACNNEPKVKPKIQSSSPITVAEPVHDSMLITIMDMPISQHNFGKVKEGAVLNTKYKFYNRGKYPIKIRRVEGACSCTTYDYPEKVEPGDSAYFSIKFDTKDKIGAQFKYLTIIANTQPSATEIMYTAEVK
jgi:Protein of unknown function (DUF1573)